MTPQERRAAEKALRKLSLSQNGRVTAEQLFELAKADRNSPFRPLFEWDKRDAFVAYNIDRARRFIASVKVVVRTERVQVTAVAYTRDPDCASDQQGYVSVDTAKEDADLKQRVLVAEFARINGHLYRARNLAKYFDLETEVAELIDNLGTLRQRVDDLHITQ